MASQFSQLRSAAQEQLGALRRQREGLDRKIAEFEGFLAILGQMETGLKIGVLESQLRMVVGGSADSLPSRIAAILRENKEAMDAGSVTKILQDQGFKYTGKAPLRVVVASEMARQAKKASGYGIRKVSTGLYTAA